MLAQSLLRCTPALLVPASEAEILLETGSPACRRCQEMETFWTEVQWSALLLSPCPYFFALFLLPLETLYNHFSIFNIRYPDEQEVLESPTPKYLSL